METVSSTRVATVSSTGDSLEPVRPWHWAICVWCGGRGGQWKLARIKPGWETSRTPQAETSVELQCRHCGQKTYVTKVAR